MKTEARQSFSHGFVLTEQELRRIADVATQQLVKVRPSPPPKTQIELRFRNGTITESDSLDDLLSLENVGAKHIVRMRISFESERDVPGRVISLPDHLISLTFANTEENKDERPISYAVRGSDRDWVFVTASELEERIAKVKSFSPRRFFSHFPFSLVVTLLFALSFMAAIYFATRPRHYSTAQTMETQWKAGTLRDPIEAIIIQQKSIETMEQNRTGRLAFAQLFGIPIAITIALSAFAGLAVYLYPPYIFCWGDYTKVFERRVQIRKYVFGVIVVGLIVGILASIIANKLTLPK
jgi:hypothetical protein